MVKLQEAVKKYANTKLVIVSPSATLGQVAKGMAEEDTDVALVKSGKDIEGVITDFDIFLAMKSYVLRDVLENLPEDVSKVKVGQIMEGTLSKDFMSVCQLTGLRPCLMIGEDETVENTIRTMAASGSHHMLVIGSDGSPIGTLSAHELLRAFID